MKKDMRRELTIGLLMQSIFLIGNRFLNVSYLFLGLLQGLAICFIIIGILPKKSYSKLKEWKSSMIKPE